MFQITKKLVINLFLIRVICRCYFKIYAIVMKSHKIDISLLN